MALSLQYLSGFCAICVVAAAAVSCDETPRGLSLQGGNALKLGTFDVGRRVRWSTLLRNDSLRSVRIEAVVASCSCVRILIKPSSVAAGDEAELAGTVDCLGPELRGATVLVKSNVGNLTVRLDFLCSELVRFDRTQLYVEDVGEGDTVRNAAGVYVQGTLQSAKRIASEVVSSISDVSVGVGSPLRVQGDLEKYFFPLNLTIGRTKSGRLRTGRLECQGKGLPFVIQLRN